MPKQSSSIKVRKRLKNYLDKLRNRKVDHYDHFGISGRGRARYILTLHDVQEHSRRDREREVPRWQNDARPWDDYSALKFRDW